MKKTHYFFSIGKDFNVKYWDGDTFALILTLPGHTRGFFFFFLLISLFFFFFFSTPLIIFFFFLQRFGPWP